MRATLLLLVAFLSGCATPIPTDYNGSDAGMVVVGLGVRGYTRFQNIALLFRRASAPETKPSEAGRLNYRYRGTFGGERADYNFEDHEERGVVVVARLPAGDYVLHNFDLFMNLGISTRSYFSQNPVEIPFTVKAGTAVYLGNFQLTELQGKNFLGMSVASGGFFAIEDRSSEELPIATRKGLPANAQVVSRIPDPRLLGNPLFVTPEARKRIAAELNID